MATEWMTTYNANLDTRDERESRHRPYIDAYTKLADRSAIPSFLEPTHPPEPTPGSTSPTPVPLRSSPKPKGTPTSGPSDAVSSSDAVTLRSQLAASNQSRATLQSQLEAQSQRLAILQSQHDASVATTASLRQQIARLERSVRDRNEELRGKSALVSSAQDELVGLTLALNLAEERVKAVEGEMGKLKAEMGSVRKENEMLVERWVKRVGKEAAEAGISDETDYRG